MINWLVEVASCITTNCFVAACQPCRKRRIAVGRHGRATELPVVGSALIVILRADSAEPASNQLRLKNPDHHKALPPINKRQRGDHIA